ncbi:hypothetical protein CUMW_138050, partial [Citrus unshiu]
EVFIGVRRCSSLTGSFSNQILVRMDVKSALIAKDVKKHRPLTPIRVFRGLICLFVMLSTAFTMIIYCGFPSAIVRKLASFFFGAWLALWPFLFEKINKTKVVFCGETVPAKERVLLIANHRTEVDWMYLWDFALRKGCHGYIKYILKSSLMKIPVFGWGFHIMEFISVERKWEIPKTPSGLLFSLKAPISLYDLTIGYKHRCPTFLDNVFGVDPSEVHIHVQRIPTVDMPTSEEKVTTWLMNKFQLKDKLLSDFYSQGHFPRQGTEAELSTAKCLVNFMAVIALTITTTYFTFFSSIWFKVYVFLSCTYLGFATYFNVRPKPVLGLVKAMFSRKLSQH